MNTLDQWLELAPKPQKLAAGQKWHVFLSYRSVHRSWVIQLYDVLRQLGFEVFLDQYVLAASDTLIAGLAEGLEKSAAGILIWSTATQDSQWCRKECDSFESRVMEGQGFYYVVATLDKVELPFFARQRIYVDFSDFREGPRGTGLLKLLYGIFGKPLPETAVRLAAAVDEETQASLTKIRACENTGDRQRLMELAQSDTLAWTYSPLLCCAAAERLIGMGFYDDALAVLDRVQALFSKAIRPRQLRGLALARKGDWRDAQIILGDLEAAGEEDPETLGIYARTWMDRYKESGMINHLRRSRDLYARAFKGSPSDYYTGINAAAKSLMLEDFAAATDYAEQVENIIGQEAVEGDYWKTATAAEVQLIKGDYAKAAELYECAVVMQCESRGSHVSTWNQAKHLMSILKPPQEDWNRIAGVFRHLDQP